MSQANGKDHRLELELTLKVSNPLTGLAYAISAGSEVEKGGDRKADVLNLLEEIFNAQMTKEMREVEGWPV